MPLRIAHLTDIHVQPEKNAAQGFEACLIHCQSQQPDLILTGGDLVMDTMHQDRARVDAQWALFHDVLNANLSTPIEYCIGNHDVWGWSDRDTLQHEAGFGKQRVMEELELATPYRSFDQGGWHFVVLDSTHPVEGNGYTAKLDDEQFEWLADDLARTTAPTLVLSHIPILAACAYFDGDNEQSGNWHVPGAWMHIDARRLKDLFLGHPQVKVCISGHIHLEDRVEYNGVTYLCNGAVCGGWWKGSYQECPPGYAMMDLNEDGTFAQRYGPWSAVS